jgi:thiamine biosynthesis lipoprotein
MVFEAIGTRWQIDSAEPIGHGLSSDILDRIAAFDLTWSRFRSDSVVSRIAESPGARDLGSDAPSIFALYERLGRATAGAVSPFVGDALNRLGYDAAYSLRASEGPRTGAPAWNDIARLDGTVLHTTSAVTIDIGAVGKGYLVDIVTGLLRAAGHSAFTVDASGDIAHRGSPIRVALEHPFDATRAVGVVSLTGGALCASATNRRAWGNGLHHVIDGRTGSPVDTVVATWALAEDTAVADGVATALVFAAPAELATTFGAEGVRIFTDGRIERSPGFPGELFR